MQTPSSDPRDVPSLPPVPQLRVRVAGRVSGGALCVCEVGMHGFRGPRRVSPSFLTRVPSSCMPAAPAPAWKLGAAVPAETTLWDAAGLGAG